MKRPEGMSFAEFKATRTALNKKLRARLKKCGVIHERPVSYFDEIVNKVVYPKKFPYVRGE